MSISISNLGPVFGVLLLIGSALHSYGSVASYRLGTPELIWALSGSLAGGLTAAINLIRNTRPERWLSRGSPQSRALLGSRSLWALAQRSEISLIH